MRGVSQDAGNPVVVKLAGALQPCDDGDCVSYLGARSSPSGTSFALTGDIAFARFYPASPLLTGHPSETAPPSESQEPGTPSGFTKTANRYIRSQNDRGAFRTGVSLLRCAELCALDLQCSSFDAGRYVADAPPPLRAGDLSLIDLATAACPGW